MIAEEWLAAPLGRSKRTRESYAYRVNSFVEAMFAMKVTHPALISPKVLDAWRSSRMKSSRRTINRDEDAVASMLKWAVSRGLCRHNPFAKRERVREAKRDAPPLIPSPPEVRRVCAWLAKHGQRGAALTLAVAATTGMRLDELRHLTTESLKGHAIHVVPERGSADEAWTPKGYRERSVNVAPASAKRVAAFVRWLCGAGGRGKPVGLSDSWIAARIDEACNATRVPRFRMHDMRRMFATECLRAGLPMSKIREWLGHRDVTTTEGYIGRYRSDAALRVPTPKALDTIGKDL